MSVQPLPSADVKRILAARAEKVDRFLTDQVKSVSGVPERLQEAMWYSLSAGGKRLRPVLCLSCAANYGLREDLVLPFAAAIEMIHTYSLIHDDLPAMDNDDFRRGKPSNHKQFDEATAILAGDGLLTDAFSLACGTQANPEAVLKSIDMLARSAGSPGMAGGQVLDMLYTGRSDISIEEVGIMQAMKTGAMLKCSCVCGAILAGAGEEEISRIGEYGAAFGKAFQVADDILDVTESTEVLGKPAGSDEASGKNTYPSLVGLEESRKLAKLESEKAISALTPGPEAPFLAGLAMYAVNRRA